MVAHRQLYLTGKTGEESGTRGEGGQAGREARRPAIFRVHSVAKPQLTALLGSYSSSRPPSSSPTHPFRFLFPPPVLSLSVPLCPPRSIALFLIACFCICPPYCAPFLLYIRFFHYLCPLIYTFSRLSLCFRPRL